MRGLTQKLYELRQARVTNQHRLAVRVQPHEKAGHVFYCSFLLPGEADHSINVLPELTAIETDRTSGVLQVSYEVAHEDATVTRNLRLVQAWVGEKPDCIRLVFVPVAEEVAPHRPRQKGEVEAFSRCLHP